MADVLSRDADALHRALDTAGDEVTIRVSRQTAEWLTHVVDARSRGQRVVVTQGHAEVTPTEAAALLGMSRPQVRKFMDDGKLAYRMVGTHHRIPLESIDAFKVWTRERHRTGMEELSRLQNELGLTE